MSETEGEFASEDLDDTRGLMLMNPVMLADKMSYGRAGASVPEMRGEESWLCLEQEPPNHH